MPTLEQTAPSSTVEQFRRDGFTVLRGVLDPDRVAAWRDAALDASRRMADNQGNAVFSQNLDVWRTSAPIAELTRDPLLGAIAQQLAGIPLRLWHDQLLIKPPRNARATEFHQDQPYWPHAGSRRTLTAWVPLVDVPVERGCMTFLPGSHRLDDLPAQDLERAGSLFGAAPQLQWRERVTIPLQVGDLTFHDGLCGHMATPNETDEARVAHAIIWVDAETTYSGAAHPVTDGLGLTPGARLGDDRFPPVAA
jgi:ectoine hydroxylase-related dioxygenase (phytanoyl-CoA dioxygenase family)